MFWNYKPFEQLDSPSGKYSCSDLGLLGSRSQWREHIGRTQCLFKKRTCIYTNSLLYAITILLKL